MTQAHAHTRAQETSSDKASAVLREAGVSVHVVKSLIHLVEQAGCSTPPLLRAAHIDPGELDTQDARFPRSMVDQLCELALDVTRDPALGLHWAESLGETAFVPISHLIAHARSLRQGFEALAQFHRLLSDESGYQLLEEGEQVTLVATRDGARSLRMQQFSGEMIVAGFFRLVRRFSVHGRPERVSFAYGRPAHHAEYTRVFEGPVFFEQPFTGIVLDRATFDAPLPHHDADVLAALQALGERRLLDITHSAPYAVRVREFLVRDGWRRQADMEVTARALSLSVRSLRRRLAEEGKAYSELADEALATVAKQLLRDKQRTIKEAAHELGFSDTSTFHRAFKRWTGSTPSTYRAAQPKREQRG